VRRRSKPSVARSTARNVRPEAEPGHPPRAQETHVERCAPSDSHGRCRAAHSQPSECLPHARAARARTERPMHPWSGAERARIWGRPPRRQAWRVGASRDYDEWGNVTNLNDTTCPIKCLHFQPFGFAGGIYEPLAGPLVRFGARDYSPLLRRWTQKDPIRFHGGQTNIYVYAGDDPINRTDPSGEYLRSLLSCLLAGNSWAQCLTTPPPSIDCSNPDGAWQTECTFDCQVVCNAAAAPAGPVCPAVPPAASFGCSEACEQTCQATWFNTCVPPTTIEFD
jgi:RHS repeat-associated protein